MRVRRHDFQHACQRRAENVAIEATAVSKFLDRCDPHIDSKAICSASPARRAGSASTKAAQMTARGALRWRTGSMQLPPNCPAKKLGGMR